MDMKKRTAALGLAVTLCLGVGVGAAASNSEAVTALLNRDLKVVYNGVEQTFTDAYGNPVYPISYNNSTYLPVRAISSLVNLPIEYNAETYAVELGTKEVQAARLVDLHHTGNTDKSEIITDPADLAVGDKTYTDGIIWDIWNSSSSSSKFYTVLFDVNGYRSVTFTAWSDIDCKVVVYDQSGALVTTFELAANTPTLKTVPLGDTQTQVGFAADGKKIWVNGTMKILDATVE